MTPLVPLYKNPSYVPDPIKWARLDPDQKQKHIDRVNKAINTAIEIDDRLNTTNYPYKSLEEVYASVVVPPGFSSVQDFLGAFSRDKFNDDFEFTRMNEYFRRNAPPDNSWATMPAERI